MKKFLTFAAVVAVSTTASAQSYIAGLDFATLDNVSTDIAFDSGSEAGLFTLNLQSGSSDDNFTYFGLYTSPGWSALGETLTTGLEVGQAGSLPTVAISGGFTASTDLFGGTSAFAQGYSDTAGIAFTQTGVGVFTIAASSAIDDLLISFDIAALVSQGQNAGSLTVNGQTVAVSTGAANQTVSLGSVSAGEIVFDLSGLTSGASFDNFMISGTVVPEPSTYAAIFGMVALGFAAHRRRRS